MRRRKSVALAAVMAAALAVTACSPGSPEGTEPPPSGDGVPYGASQEEWIAAFEDVDPITLYSQVLYAEGDLNNLQYLDYFDAIEEYSGGKITFDIAYASSVAPYLEVYQAIVDGRLDIGITSPSFMPVDFPAYAAWTELGGALGPKGAFPGVLHTYSWTADGMLANSQIADEFEDFGLHLLQPFTYAGYDQGLICTQERSTLDDFRNTNIVVSSPSQARLAEAIGMSPVSLPFQEWFDAIQRGVAECASNTMTASSSLGLFEVAPHATLDSDVFFGNLGQGALAINKDRWDDLPLVAQQLLFDQLPAVTLAALEQTHFQRIIDSLAQLDGIAGSSLNEFDPEVREVLLEVLNGTLDNVAQSGALDYSQDELEALTDDLIAKWEGIIDGFGYPTFTYSELITDWETANVDLNEWNTAFFEEIFLPHRPS